MAGRPTHATQAQKLTWKPHYANWHHFSLSEIDSMKPLRGWSGGATPGHIGEFIAAAIFRIQLFESATNRGADGVFTTGPLQGRTVNVKLYGKQEGLLDVRADAIPEYYLVLTGPRSGAVSSRGQTRPMVIQYAYLFCGPTVLCSLQARGVQVSCASSVKQAEWQAAEVWPTPRNPLIQLDPIQIAALELFARREQSDVPEEPPIGTIVIQ